MTSVNDNHKSLLVDIREVSRMLGEISTRQIYRLADAGKMPKPMKLGSLNRWNRNVLADWINGGCRPSQN